MNRIASYLARCGAARLQQSFIAEGSRLKAPMTGDGTRDFPRTPQRAVSRSLSVDGQPEKKERSGTPVQNTNIQLTSSNIQLYSTTFNYIQTSTTLDTE